MCRYAGIPTRALTRQVSTRESRVEFERLCDTRDAGWPDAIVWQRAGHVLASQTAAAVRVHAGACDEPTMLTLVMAAFDASASPTATAPASPI